MRITILSQHNCSTMLINWVQNFDSQGNILDIRNYSLHHQRLGYQYIQKLRLKHQLSAGTINIYIIIVCK
jgi:hypothetical protein